MGIDRDIAQWQVETTQRQASRDALQPLFSLNEQFLKAIAHSVPTSARASPLVVTMRDDFRQMSAEARRRLARSPLLVEAGFATCNRWSIDVLHQSRPRRADPNRTWLSRSQAVGFARSTFFLAWYFVHTFPSAPRLILGMSDACIAFFAQLKLGDIQRLSECRYDWIRPRWESDPSIWRSLISLARNPPKTIPGAVTLHAMSLISADVRRDEQSSSTT